MMTCRELTEFLSDYVAGDLPHKVTREFDLHLRLCRDCKVFMVQFRETIEAGRCACDDSEGTAPIPEDLVHAIMTAVARGRSDGG